MKKLFYMILVSFACSYSAEQINIAVMPPQAAFQSKDGLELLAAKMEATLVETNQFHVVERAQMDKILQEQGFQQSGVCDSSSCDVQMGKLLGVDKIIVSNIAGRESDWVIVGKLIDVQTGLIERTITKSSQMPIHRFAVEDGVDFALGMVGIVREKKTSFFQSPLFAAVASSVLIGLGVAVYYSSQTVTKEETRDVNLEIE